VFLIAVPTVHIESVFVQPDLAKGTLSAEVTLRNDTDHIIEAKLNGVVHEWLNKAGKSMLDAPEPNWTLASTSAASTNSQTVTIRPHASNAATIVATHVGDRLKRWSPQHPNLYGLVCRIGGQDSKYTRFGWRQVSFQGSKVLLNGGPVIMKGDSWHFMGIPQMSRRYAWAWFKALQDANLNAVRLHAEPYPSFYLDMADEMGILVLDETAVWASDGGPKVDDPGFWKDTERHLSELIRRDRNHPAVFGWSVSNEVSAVIRGVFHAPKSMEDEGQLMNGVWAQICQSLDPTRPWISADGEEDGKGVLPTYVIHYGDRSTMDRAIASGKPWGVGEAGPAYYGTPQQIAEQSGFEGAYLSVADRMQGVALVSYRSLMDQREKGASYRSVFNLVWYGLQPLELGLEDASRPPTLSDGIFFKGYVEGQPGVQPERLGPYCSTLNPGFDPKLPLFRPWPLFNAIKDAQAEPPIPFPGHPITAKQSQIERPSPQFSSVRVLGGSGSELSGGLTDLGARVSADAKILFVDGAHPMATGKRDIDRALAAGQTVFVWGPKSDTVATLNSILPFPLELTNRTTTSLVAVKDDVTWGIAPSDLYFSELSPSIVLSSGLAGPLIARSKILLAACDADWRLWNGQPETTKTAMIFRSEREAKPSGVALSELKVGSGRLYVCNLPLAPSTSRGEKLSRSILLNLGVELLESKNRRNVIDATGRVEQVLSLGAFPASSFEDAIGRTIVWPDWEISRGRVAEGRVWKQVSATADGNYELPAEHSNSISYLSFWIYSPKSLDNLLLDPHLPTARLEVVGAAATQVWLGTKRLGADATLPLQQGWNHVLIKSIGSIGNGIGIRIVANQPEFLSQLRGALEKQ